MSDTGLGNKSPYAPDFEMPMKNPDKGKEEQGEESLGARESNIPYEPRDTGEQGGGSKSRGNGIGQNARAGLASFAGLMKSKKGATGTIITIIGLLGGGMAAFSPFANIGLKENPVNTLDTSHRIMAPRTPKILTRLTSGNTGDAPEGSLQDKMNSPTKKLIRSYTKAGAIPMNGDTPIDPKTLEGRGKPDIKPTHYKVDGLNIEPANLDKYMNDKNNIKLKNRVLGRNGSMNMVQRLWNDSARQVKKVHKPLNLSRKGGVADDSSSTAEEKRSKFKKKLPGQEKSSSVKSNISGKFNKHVGKFKKAGAAATLAAGACIGLKLPKIITGAVAAIQLLQLLPFSTDLYLSPADKQKGSLVNNISAEDVSGFMDPLTDVYEDEATGTKGSALDSKILLQAMGLVTTNLGVSRFAPGYSMMKNPVVQASKVVDDSYVGDICDVILSPASMYAMMATDFVVRAVSGPFALILGGIEYVLIETLTPKVIEAATNAAVNNSDAIIEALGNKELIDAVGVPLGDAIGTSLMALFSLSSLTRLGPAAAVSNIPEASRIINDQIAEERQMEIASLSPLDISSRWTFLGSIVYNLNASMLVSGQHKNPAFSIIPTILGQASSLLGPKNAQANSEEARSALMKVMYNNADECGMSDGTNGNPAVTAACTPVSLPFEELNSMEPEEAIQIITDEGWINPDIIPENYDPDTMVKSNFIVKDTWLSEYITDRDELFSGDYLFSTAGFRTDVDSAADSGNKDSDQVAESQIKTIDNPDAKTAAVVFLQDMQVMNILNGDDDPAYMSEGSGNEMIDPLAGGITGPVDPSGWASPVEAGNVITSGYGPRNGPFNGNEFHDGLDLAPAGGAGTAILAVRNGTVVASGPGGTWGNMIAIDHGEVSGLGQIYSFYAHLASANVSVGQQVTAGQQIGVMGTTGISTGVHLHFSIYKNYTGSSDGNGSNSYNPVQIIPQLEGG